MSAVTIAQSIEKDVAIVGEVSSVAVKIEPWINLVGGLFPGVTSVLAAIQIAAPIIQKIAVSAPIATQAIEAGMPVFEAIDKASPELLAHIKALYAIFTNADPTRPETNMTADDVSDVEALAFAGPVLLGRAWTQPELERWWDVAKGTV